MIKKTVTTFFKAEAATGILLLLSTILALSIANSSNSSAYFEFLKIPLPLAIDFLNIEKNLSLRDWINDALMAIFFFLISLELKKEILIGELSTKRKASLPLIAALGGVIFPAIIFIIININNSENLRGFAIPTATDIAFAYGILCLFGKKISKSLKIFIVSLAVIDDLVAILIIAFFYSKDLQISYLLLSLIPLVGLVLLNFKGSDKIFLYVILGIFLWLMILKSGVHSTLAGVLLAAFIPLKINNKNLLENLAHKISPTVNFLILPLFAFANSGIEFKNFSYDFFGSFFTKPLTMGIIVGMFFGKQIGVMLFSFLAVKFKISHLPQGCNWREFYAASIFTGIGFTMSIFIAGLAFIENDTLEKIMLDEVKLAILIGSLLSILYGSFITTTFTKQKIEKYEK